MSAYKDNLAFAMLELAADPLVRFIGYGVRYGGKAAGTLKGVSDAQLIETPVAENLMVGMAIGMSLRGLRPVVFIERFDFILNALDAIVNHLDKIAELSGGLFQPAMILRVVAGNKTNGLQTGLTHTQDFYESISRMVSFPVLRILHDVGPGGPMLNYRSAHARLQGRFDDGLPAEGSAKAGPPMSTMLIEYKDLY